MTVTIGLPVFNCELTLESAVRSLFAQTFTDWRLVIVDDGSTDRTPELARRIADPRVTVLCDGRNLGLVPRLNQLAELARTEYLARMDGDDLSHPERLARQVAFLDAHPEIDAVGTHGVGIDDRDRVVSLRADPFSEDAETVFRRRFLIHASILGRTAWFRRNPYDPAYPRSEDHELWIRTLGTSRYAVLPEPLYFIREVGVVSPAKYAASCRTDRRIYRRYGPAAIGLARTARFVASSAAKECVYRAASAVGLASAIASRRGVTPPPALAAEIGAIIGRINATPLPRDDRGASVPPAP